MPQLDRQLMLHTWKSVEIVNHLETITRSIRASNFEKYFLRTPSVSNVADSETPGFKNKIIIN